jgi:signal transduction histidine kinase
MAKTETRAGVRRRSVEKLGRDGLRMRLGHGPEAAAEARQAIVTNSVRHTEAPDITLRVAVGKDAVLTEVADDGPGFDPDGLGEAGTDACGWGLFLVQRLAQSWGVKEDGGSKRVWFELSRA